MKNSGEAENGLVVKLPLGSNITIVVSLLAIGGVGTHTLLPQTSQCDNGPMDTHRIMHQDSKVLLDDRFERIIERLDKLEQ